MYRWIVAQIYIYTDIRMYGYSGLWSDRGITDLRIRQPTLKPKEETKEAYIYTFIHLYSCIDV